MIRSKDHRFDLRLRLARHAATRGIEAVARQFGCVRNTVRVWRRRLQHGGRGALIEHSRAPHPCPHKTSPAQERPVAASYRHPRAC
ncbi:MAG: helix-turn-helix domain-containing protein [bacterium]|nr:helix-turn-helix domain-containing protein [bacterium]